MMVILQECHTEPRRDPIDVEHLDPHLHELTADEVRLIEDGMCDGLRVLGVELLLHALVASPLLRVLNVLGDD
jgi:hypothetical protein